MDEEKEFFVCVGRRRLPKKFEGSGPVKVEERVGLLPREESFRRNWGLNRFEVFVGRKKDGNFIMD